MIGDRIDADCGIEPDAFGCAPLDRRGGPGRGRQLFGAELPRVTDELNKKLSA